MTTFLAIFFLGTSYKKIVRRNIPWEVSGGPLFQVKLHEVESSLSFVYIMIVDFLKSPASCLFTIHEVDLWQVFNDCCIARRVHVERIV